MWKINAEDDELAKGGSFLYIVFVLQCGADLDNVLNSSKGMKKERTQWVKMRKRMTGRPLVICPDRTERVHIYAIRIGWWMLKLFLNFEDKLDMVTVGL